MILAALLSALHNGLQGDGLQRTQRRNPRQHHADAARVAHNAANWRPSAASLQRFPPKAICVVLAQDCCGSYFKHHWLIIACDSCGTVVDLDLRVKPRDTEAPVRLALRDVHWPRCNGHGRPRIIALARHPSV